LCFLAPLCFIVPLPKLILPSFPFFCNVWEIQHSTLEFGKKLGSIKFQVGGSNKFFWNFFWFSFPIF
jgi:hypothetical protein